MLCKETSGEGGRLCRNPSRQYLLMLWTQDGVKIFLNHKFQQVSYQDAVRRPAIARALQWRHNRRDGVWNHRFHDCLLNRLFRRKSKKTLRHWPLCRKFPAQMTSNAGNISIWWRHHVAKNYAAIQAVNQYVNLIYWSILRILFRGC